MKYSWICYVYISVLVGGIVNTAGLHPVDPELAERSAAETAESAVFIFPSMKMDLLSLDTRFPFIEVKYRGEPPRFGEQLNPAPVYSEPIALTPQDKDIPYGGQVSQTKDEEIESRSLPEENNKPGVETFNAVTSQPHLEITPGRGSWSYNSIVLTAQAGLQPQHVPLTADDDLTPESSERVISTHTLSPIEESDKSRNYKSQGDKPPKILSSLVSSSEAVVIPALTDGDIDNTIKSNYTPSLGEFKHLLQNSNDYKQWLVNKSRFLRELERSSTIEEVSGKFPHFPDRKSGVEPEMNVLDKNADVLRPQRESIHSGGSSLPVYKDGDTLYLIPSKEKESTKQIKTTARPDFSTTSLRPRTTIKISQLTPRTPYSAHIFTSPSYSRTKPTMGPLLTSPLPPLPPGYELVPISQLTPEHEVVPWEQLPRLMEEHNLTLEHISLGPFQHSSKSNPSHQTTISSHYTTHNTRYETTANPSLYSTPTVYLKSTQKQVYEDSSTTKSNYGMTPLYDSTKTPLHESSPHSEYVSTPKPIYQSSESPAYIYTPSLYGSQTSPAYGSTPKPFYGSTPTPIYNSSLKPAYGYPTPSYISTSKSIYVSPTPRGSPASVESSTPKSYYRSSPVPRLTFVSSTPHSLINFPIGGIISPHMPPPVSQDVGGFFTQNEHSLYSPKHGHPAPPSYPKPKSIHFGTDFANSYSDNKFKYDPTISPSEISGSDKHNSRAPVYYPPSLSPSSVPRLTTPHSFVQTSFNPSLGPKFKTDNSMTTPFTHFLQKLHSSPGSLDPSRKVSTPKSKFDFADNTSTIPAPTQEPLSILPPPMPHHLSPPNLKHPTYFDVAQQVQVHVNHHSNPYPVPNPIEPDQSTPSQSYLFLEMTPRPEINSNQDKDLEISLNLPRKNEELNIDKIPPQVQFFPTRPSVVKSTIKTTHVAVLMPQEAVPSLDNLQLNENDGIKENRQKEFEEIKLSPFPSFVEKSPSISGNQKELDRSSTRIPETVTKESRNKMRSSTEKQTFRKKGRLKIRPNPTISTRTNFHPIPSGPITPSTNLPQARPNVPELENSFQLPSNSPAQKHELQNKQAVMDKDELIEISGSNRLWVSKDKDSTENSQLKREFTTTQSGSQTNFKVALHPDSRVWPANLAQTKSFVEEERTSELEPQEIVIQSTTISTSRVELKKSTTPSTITEVHTSLGNPLNLLKELREQDDENKKDILIHNKGKSPNFSDMDAASSLNESQTSIVSNNKVSSDDMKELAKLMKLRRRKLRQRAKSLMSAMEDMNDNEPFVVLPMHQVNPHLKIDVDEIFDPDKHPGVKRISAYDFEQMLNSNGSITVADNKFQEMLSEITTFESDIEPETIKPLAEQMVTDESKETIYKLKEEIEKLTRTLQEFQLAPGHRTEQDDYIDFDIDDDITARTANSENIKRISLMEASDGSNNLEIEETFTSAPPSSLIQYNTPSVKLIKDLTTKEDVTSHGKEVGSTGILGLFETISQLDADTQNNFAVTRFNSVGSSVGLEEKDVSPRLQDVQDKMEEIQKQIEEEKRWEEIKKVEIEQIAESQRLEKLKQEEIMNKEIREKELKKIDDLKRLEEMRRMEKKRLDRLRQEKEKINLEEIIRREEERKEEERKFHLEKQKEEEINQMERYEELQEKLRIQEQANIKQANEELRKQQMEKLKIFDLERLFDDQKSVHEQEMEQISSTQSTKKKPKITPTRNKNENDSITKFNSDLDLAQQTETSDSNTKPGVAFASITIEDVGNSHDYEVNGGIVKIKRGKENESVPDYEYEYYEASPEDIQFPVGPQLVQSHEDNLEKLSNKDLLLKLLKESNNFQNGEFLSKLKKIILEKAEAGNTEAGNTEEELLGLSEADKGDPYLRSIDGGGWSPSQPGKRRVVEEEKGPVWPSRNSIKPPSDQGELVLHSFLPSKQVRFPVNRRSDPGIGEVVLLTDVERKKATSISGFKQEEGFVGSEPLSSSGYNILPNSDKSASLSFGNGGSDTLYSGYGSRGNSDILSRVDISSNEEFVVGTSLTMGGSSSSSSSSEGSFYNSGGEGYGIADKLENELIKKVPSASLDSGFGIVTPIQLTDPVVREPPLQSGSKRSDSSKLAELLKLRAAIQKMKNNQSQQQGNNFFLQTFNNYGNNEGTEVYADLRMEQSKKNLLTLPTDPNQMYIKKGQNGPTAEVILYPMGQLLSGPLGQQFTHRNSDETIYERSVKVKDEVSSASGDGSVESESPKGILQTIMRSAQDDFKIVGNVFKHLTGSETK